MFDNWKLNDMQSEVGAACVTKHDRCNCVGANCWAPKCWTFWNIFIFAEIWSHSTYFWVIFSYVFFGFILVFDWTVLILFAFSVLLFFFLIFYKFSLSFDLVGFFVLSSASKYTASALLFDIIEKSHSIHSNPIYFHFTDISHPFAIERWTM